MNHEAPTWNIRTRRRAKAQRRASKYRAHNILISEIVDILRVAIRGGCAEWARHDRRMREPGWGEMSNVRWELGRPWEGRWEGPRRWPRTAFEWRRSRVGKGMGKGRVRKESSFRQTKIRRRHRGQRVALMDDISMRRVSNLRIRDLNKSSSSPAFGFNR